MNEGSFTPAVRCTVPRLVIAGVKGGSGKTIFSLGLARHLVNAGRRVAVFKKGPDYIDAKWLSAAARAECSNLDPYFMDDSDILALFARRARGSDMALTEGNRGLYDGVDKDGTCSTAQLAKLLAAPVVLVIDCAKITRSAAAVALGFKVLDSEVEIAGVVLNNVAGRRHRRILTSAIEEYAGLPVLAALPRMKQDPLPMRHLGLTPLEEHSETEARLDHLASLVEDNCDIDMLLDLTAGARPIEASALDLGPLCTEGAKGVRIGIPRDSAFQFYYPENFDALERHGAELLFLDAVRDRSVPELDALYIGGGFPETNAAALANNRSFLEGVRSQIAQGLPVYAECGGLMYLGDSIIWKGRRFPMLGVVGWDFVMEERPVGHGYSRMRFASSTPFFSQGSVVTGHEFHYSRPVLSDPARQGVFACEMERGHGFGEGREGLLLGNVFGTYTHLHAVSAKEWACGVVRAAGRYRSSRQAPAAQD